MKPDESATPKKWVKGNPFIPIWLDDFGLNDAEMRLMVHLWRRGKLCYPSVETIAKHLGKKEETVWRLLKSVEEKGLLTRRKRKKPGVRNGNEYILHINPKPPTPSVGSNAPSHEGSKPCTRGGKKVHHRKEPHIKERVKYDSDTHRFIDNTDSKPMPDGMAHIVVVDDVALPSVETAIGWALEHYNKHIHSSESFIGVLDEKEIREMTEIWLNDLKITGGMFKGSPVRMPKQLLTAYLDKASLRQSKRCVELKECPETK